MVFRRTFLVVSITQVARLVEQIGSRSTFAAGVADRFRHTCSVYLFPADLFGQRRSKSAIGDHTGPEPGASEQASYCGLIHYAKIHAVLQ